MIVMAFLAIRNEELYLLNCLRHLVKNDIYFTIIDNQSCDASSEIYRRREFAGHLAGVGELPYHGAFSLTDQLQRKMTMIREAEADWVIHLDADEIMHSYRSGESLHDAVARVDKDGWNVIDFDEFVFLPIDQCYLPEALGEQPMRLYYFHQPFAPRLMRAWRKTSELSLTSGGHLLEGRDIRIAPERFALRHYMFRDQQHAFDKYAMRRFAAEDIARGWHVRRIGQPVEAFRFPGAERLRTLSGPEDRNLDRSDPWRAHYWLRERPVVAGADPQGKDVAGASTPIEPDRPGMA